MVEEGFLERVGGGKYAWPTPAICDEEYAAMIALWK
jgi:hypothetical protein